MKTISSLPSPRPVDASGIVTWVHIGDLHLTGPEDQNSRDLHSIVDTLNRNFSTGVNFVFLPGDMAEHGQPAEFALVRAALDRLEIPWFSIIGDHDVHTHSFDAYCEAILPAEHYSFNCGGYLFLALNAFSRPAPNSFTVDDAQLCFIDDRLATLPAGDRAVLFLHCYPSDLKAGYEALRDRIVRHRPLLVEMGHTHYNEIARDTSTVYVVTRSTGQIEEGTVGFSITSLDRGCVSWKFRDLASTEPFVMITSPAEWRLTPVGSPAPGPVQEVRARIWSDAPVGSVYALCNHQAPIPMEPIAGTNVWQATWPPALESGTFIRVVAETVDGREAFDEVRILDPQLTRLAPRDQDNAIGAWPERHILGTQLGPNKNGKKW